MSVKGAAQNVWVAAEDLGLGCWDQEGGWRDIGLYCRTRNLHHLEKNLISATLE